MLASSRTILIKHLQALRVCGGTFQVNQDCSVTVHVHPSDLEVYATLPECKLKELILLCVDARDPELTLSRHAGLYDN